MLDTSNWRPAAQAARFSSNCLAVHDLAASLWQSHGVDEALARIRRMAVASPRDGNLRAVQGRMLYASGRREEAATALAAAATFGSEIEILELLARAVFPGPSYHRHLKAIHRWLRPAVYLEIGVFDGDSLSLAEPGTLAVGVDPEPRSGCRRTYAAATHIHAMTSDAYFAELAANRPQERFDLAFIDGMHVFEQVLADFINVERQCHADSVVVLHDTLPVAEAATARQRQTAYWCGDVWKMLPLLRRHRPDLQLLTIPAFPSGLTLVRGLDPQSRVLARCFPQAVAEWIDTALPPEAMAPASLGDVTNDSEQIRAWLQPH